MPATGGSRPADVVIASAGRLTTADDRPGQQRARSRSANHFSCWRSMPRDARKRTTTRRRRRAERNPGAADPQALEHVPRAGRRNRVGSGSVVVLHRAVRAEGDPEANAATPRRRTGGESPASRRQPAVGEQQQHEGSRREQPDVRASSRTTRVAPHRSGPRPQCRPPCSRSRGEDARSSNPAEEPADRVAGLAGSDSPRADGGDEDRRAQPMNGSTSPLASVSPSTMTSTRSRRTRRPPRRAPRDPATPSSAHERAPGATATRAPAASSPPRRAQVGAERLEVDVVAQPRAERLERPRSRRTGAGRSAGRRTPGRAHAAGGTARPPPASTRRSRDRTAGDRRARLSSSTSADVGGAQQSAVSAP